jgi:hypothetical protein
MDSLIEGCAASLDGEPDAGRRILCKADGRVNASPCTARSKCTGVAAPALLLILPV